GKASATVINDDTTLSVGDVTVVEGDSGTLNALFQLKLSVPSGAPLTVNYATADGTAIAGPDYAAASGSVTFQPGETSKTIAVVIPGDLTPESRSKTFMAHAKKSATFPCRKGEPVRQREHEANQVFHLRVAGSGCPGPPRRPAHPPGRTSLPG